MAIPRFRLNRKAATAQGLVGLWGPGLWGSEIDYDLAPARMHNGVLVGDVTWVSDGERQGIVPRFAGTDDRIAIPHHPQLAVGVADCTILCWFNSESWAASYPALFVKGTGGSNRDYAFYINSTTAGHWAVGNTGGWGWSGSSGFTTGIWHHLALVRRGTDIFCYLDGVEKFTRASVTGNTDSGGELRWGLGVGTVFDYTGRLDDRRVYSRGLSAAEIQHIYQKTKPSPFSDIAMQPRPVVKAAVAAGLSIPIAMHHYTKNITAA